MFLNVLFNNLTDVTQFGYLGCLNAVHFVSAFKISCKICFANEFLIAIQSFLTNLTVNVKF